MSGNAFLLRRSICMQAALLFFCISLPLSLCASDQSSYLIVSVAQSSVLYRDTPKWICFLNEAGFCEHVGASEKLVSIKPGKYLLGHIDFNTSQNIPASEFKYKPGASYFSEKIPFEFLPNRIYILGKLRMKLKGPSRKLIARFARSEHQVKLACKNHSDIFENFPISNLDGSSQTFYRCKLEKP